jgi:hypothetical protein
MLTIARVDNGPDTIPGTTCSCTLFAIDTMLSIVILTVWAPSFVRRMEKKQPIVDLSKLQVVLMSTALNGSITWNTSQVTIVHHFSSGNLNKQANMDNSFARKVGYLISL